MGLNAVLSIILVTSRQSLTHYHTVPTFDAPKKEAF